MKNGMILATARSPLLPSNGLPADRELYTLRPDGTGLATLRCDHQHPAIRSQAQELDDGAVVFVKSSLTSRSLGGQSRLDSPRRVAQCTAHGPAHSRFVAAARCRAMNCWSRANPHRRARQERNSTLYAFDAATGKFGAPIYEDPKLSTVEAVPVAAHEPPRWYWSTLNPDLKRGYFICLDGYLAEGVPHGQDCGKAHASSRADARCRHPKGKPLGEAPMEEDGSFYIAVPPDTAGEIRSARRRRPRGPRATELDLGALRRRARLRGLPRRSRPGSGKPLADGAAPI